MRRIRKPRASPGHGWAVSKTMQADARGALKLAERYGPMLICVRYRSSPDGNERITTVELEVDRAEVRKKANPFVWVKIYASERQLTAKAKSKGAWFNAKTRLWRMRQNDAYVLGLQDRVARPDNQN